MAVDGRENVRSILPTISRPSTALLQVPLDTGPPGHGHVRRPRLPGRHNQGLQ